MKLTFGIVLLSCLPLLHAGEQAPATAKNHDSTILVGEPSSEMQKLIRDIVISSMPHEYEDNSKWGMTREIVSGLDVKRDGFRIRTKRRKRDVPHGTWKRFEIALLNPRQNFALHVDQTRMSKPGTFEFRARCSAPLTTTARLQEYNRGVRLLSLTAEAIASVDVVVECEVQFQTVNDTFPPELQLIPHVTKADVNLRHFQLRRVSHLKGRVANELGQSLRRVLVRQIDRKREKLPGKINKQIGKKKDKLRVSTADLFSSRWNWLFQQNPTATTSRSGPNE